jgi:hypothetical protein
MLQVHRNSIYIFFSCDFCNIKGSTIYGHKFMRWLKTYVESLNIAPYGRFRSDCPLCGKPNTFSVSDNGFERLWFCFHADCSAKGATGVSLTKENSKSAFVKREPKQKESRHQV